MTSNKFFAVVFAFLLFFLSLSTILLAGMDGDFNRLPTMLWEENFFAEARAVIDRFIGIKEQNGVYISDDALIKITETPDESTTQHNEEMIKTVSSTVTVPVCTMLIPTANVILQNKLPKYAKIWDQNKYMDEVYAEITGYSSVVRSYDTLIANGGKEIYYRTSDNLTPLGGYYLYRALCPRLGFYPQELESYSIEYYDTDFYGELMEKTGYRQVPADSVTFYRNNFRLGNIETTVYDSDGKRAVRNDIFIRQTQNLSLCYPGSFPITEIKNQSVKNGKILIIADHTAQSLASFLVDHYSEVTVWNPFVNRSDYAPVPALDDYDQILFLFSTETFGTVDFNFLDRLNL